MSKQKMSSAPPGMPKTPEEFIDGARKPRQSIPRKAVAKEAPPWEADSVREDVIKSVNLRLPEPIYIMLQFVSSKTRTSQQELIREALVPSLNQKVDELREKGEL